VSKILEDFAKLIMQTHIADAFVERWRAIGRPVTHVAALVRLSSYSIECYIELPSTVSYASKGRCTLNFAARQNQSVKRSAPAFFPLFASLAASASSDDCSAAAM